MITALLICFIVGMMLGAPLVIVLMFSAIIPSFLDSSFLANVPFVLRAIVGGGDSTTILASPLFILSGIIMAKGGISQKIFDVFAYWLGRVPGGLPCAVVATCLFYGAISGSGQATCAAVGAMTIPILLEMGYDNKFSGALVATAAGLGVVIPPSNPFVMYGVATGGSIGDMFIAGVIPGILIAACLMAYAVFHCAHNGEDRVRIDDKMYKLRKNGFLHLLKDGIWALICPVILLGGIYSGVVTTTEVACVSVLYALFVSIFIYKTVKGKELLHLLVSSFQTMCPILLLMAMAVAFGRVLTVLQVPYMVSTLIIDNFSSKIGVLLILNVVMLLIGMVMDTGPAMMILAPILLPVTTALGIDPVHLGIIMVVNMAIGFVTPPFGVTLFVASPVSGATPMEIGKQALCFIAAEVVALMVITFIPEVSLCLLS